VNKQEIFKKINLAIMEGDADEAAGLVKSIAGEVDPLEIVNVAMTPAMKTVGDKFGAGEIFLPEMLQATEAWNEAMKILKPRMLEKGKTLDKAGTVVIGTVQTDIHEIGKNIVANLMMASGFEVHDIGVDVHPATFVEKAEEVGADIIAASAIMTTTMPYQKDVIDYLKAAGRREKYLVLVGGGVVTREWANRIGADGYGELASDAVNVARTLLAERRKK
jgi:corrinoid protein of di/trimethylamine methyltransferase